MSAAIETAARTRSRAGGRIERLATSAYEIPTDGPDGKESDGTLEWRSTTLVVVRLHAGDAAGLGYTYGPKACAVLVSEALAGCVLDRDPLAVGERFLELASALRNAGRPGIGMLAVSALDVALWDLKARLLGAPLADVLGCAREAVPVYGSGGFCNYPLARLEEQLAGWVEAGIPRVKLKVGRDPREDPARLRAAREAVGPDAELFVDANCALGRKQALAFAERLRSEWGVSWFEEPVSSDDVEGLRLLRDRGPAGLDIAAGEYVYGLVDAARLVGAGAVDCLQLDVTRCGGVSGLLQASAVAAARGLQVSGHCAPQASAHVLCAVPNARHLEYFHDHVRIERLAFEGALEPEGGALRPDRSRPGLGLELRADELAGFQVYAAEAHA